MEKIKDFIYNISDVLLSLVIVFVMVFIFYKNMGVFFGNQANISFKEFVQNKIAYFKGGENVKSQDEKTPALSKIETDVKESENQNLQDNISSVNEFVKDKQGEISDYKNEKNLSDAGKNLEAVPAQNPQVENKSQNVQNQNQQNIQNTQNAENTQNQNQQNTNKQLQSESPKVTVTIPDMTTTEKVAQILEQNNIIKSSDQFVSYLVEHKLDTKVMSGDFNLSQNMSYEDVSNIICRK